MTFFQVQFVFKLLVFISLWSEPVFGQCRQTLSFQTFENLLNSDQGSGLKSWAFNSRGLERNKRVKKHLDFSQLILPMPIEMRETDVYQNDYSIYDYSGQHVKELSAEPLGYGRHLFLLALVGPSIKVMTVPEFSLVDTVGDGVPEKSFVGSHRGIWQALKKMAGKLDVMVLASGEFTVLGGGFIYEVYGRSGNFQGKQEHLSFTRMILPQIGARLAPVSQFVAYSDRPQVALRHVPLLNGKEDMVVLAGNKLKVERDPHLKAIRDLMVDFVTQLYLFTSENPDWLKLYPSLVGNYMFVDTRTSSYLERMNLLARRSFGLYAQLVSSVLGFEPEHLILKYQSSGQLKDILERMIDVLEIWTEKRAVNLENPFTPSQQRKWTTLRAKLKRTLKDLSK